MSAKRQHNRNDPRLVVLARTGLAQACWFLSKDSGRKEVISWRRWWSKRERVVQSGICKVQVLAYREACGPTTGLR